MKSFILPIPKTPSKIDYHYFCECGKKFVSNKDNKVCKCGNGRFFSYDDIKNYNTDLLEIEKIKNGYIAFFEYPFFSHGKIKIERKILFEYINILKFNDFVQSQNKDKLIAEFVKLCMIKENKWKKYRYIWEKLKYTTSIFLILIHKDPEMALWKYVDIEKIHKLSVIEFFEQFLKDTPKSVKKAVFCRYKKLIKKWRYNYYLDLLVLNAIYDINLQRELIKKATNLDTVFYSNDEEILEFVKFLKDNFTQRKIYNFLQKAIKSKSLSEYLSLFRDKGVKIIDKKSIENTLLKATDEIKYNYKFDIKYRFKGFVFELPKTSFDLVKYSFKLKNCLESYIKIHNNKSLIFGVYKENNLKYAIELDKNSKELIQARGFANSKINSEDYKVIVDFVNEFKEVI